ncbi:hypothetical protein MXB_4268 [Myxobolus squamalis]|nr:hypothetical protein MXB_4268 [Myxobolus squamalis]
MSQSMMTWSGQHRGKLQRPLEFPNKWSADFYDSMKTPYFCQLQLTQTEIKKEWGNMRMLGLL